MRILPASPSAGVRLLFLFVAQSTPFLRGEAGGRIFQGGAPRRQRARRLVKKKPRPNAAASMRLIWQPEESPRRIDGPHQAPQAERRGGAAKRPPLFGAGLYQIGETASDFAQAAMSAPTQAGLDKRRGERRPAAAPSPRQNIETGPTDPAPPLERLPSIEQRQPRPGPMGFSIPTIDRIDRKGRLAPAPPPKKNQPNRARTQRDSSAFGGRLASAHRPRETPRMLALQTVSQRLQTLNALSPGPRPGAIAREAARAKGVNAIRPIGKTALGNRPADRRRKRRGRQASRRKTKKMGRTRKKTGETKPKISGEKIECAQLDVNSAGFGAKPRQAADWETGAAQARRRTKIREK